MRPRNCQSESKEHKKYWASGSVHDENTLIGCCFWQCRNLAGPGLPDQSQGMFKRRLFSKAVIAKNLIHLKNLLVANFCRHFELTEVPEETLHRSGSFYQCTPHTLGNTWSPGSHSPLWVTATHGALGLSTQPQAPGVGSFYRKTGAKSLCLWAEAPLCLYLMHSPYL